MADRINLHKGYSMTYPKVNPSNYKTCKSNAVKDKWYIWYHLYSPNETKPKLVISKGMNKSKTIEEKIFKTDEFLSSIIEVVKRKYNAPVYDSNTLNPDTHFIQAFRLASKQKKCSSSQKDSFRVMINRMEKALPGLDFAKTSIEDLKRRELKQLFVVMNLTDSVFNHYKEYTSSLYKVLIEEECCDVNITRDIEKKKITKRHREIIPSEHVPIVLKYLKEHHYNFWRYTMIFIFSGSRNTEFFRLKRKEVYLSSQEYKVTIQKGRQYKEKIKVILLPVLDLWKEVCKGSKPEQHVFSKGFVPGDKMMARKTVTQYWYRNVKKYDGLKDSEGNQIKITADFYAFKHFFLDSLSKEDAQRIGALTNSRTTAIYQVNQEKRDREELKKLDVSFLKVV